MAINSEKVTKIVINSTEIINTNNDTASPADVVSGKTYHGSSGKATGAMPNATFSVSGNIVKSNTAGYVPASTTVGTVATVSRAATTLTSSADTTNAKLTFTAGNNQGTGYVTGSNSTASKTVTLTASGASVTASDGTNSVSKSVATVSRASTTMSSSADTTNAKLTISASNNQGTGYVTGSNQTASKTVTLTASGQTVTASDGTNSVSKSVATGTAGTPTASKGTVSNNSISVTPSVTNTTGYITGGTKTGTAVTVNASELVSGNKACSSAEGAQSNIDVTNYKTVSISGVGSSYIGSAIPYRSPGQGLVDDKYGSDGVDARWCRIPSGYYPQGGSQPNDTYLYLADTDLKDWANVCGLGYNAGVSDTKKGTAGAAQVLSGYTFTNSSSVNASGTMANNGAISGTITANRGTYIIPAGYHNGSGSVTALVPTATWYEKTISVTSTSAASLSFTGLTGEPKAFMSYFVTSGSGSSSIVSGGIAYNVVSMSNMYNWTTALTTLLFFVNAPCLTKGMLSMSGSDSQLSGFSSVYSSGTLTFTFSGGSSYRFCGGTGGSWVLRYLV